MSLDDFNTLYVPILNLGVTGLGLISVIILVKQYQKDNRWRRLQSSYNFIGIGEEFNLQQKIYNVYFKLGIYPFPEVCNPLTESQINIIAQDPDATLITNMFLNHLQNLCIAFTFGLVNDDVFKNIHASRIRWWYTILKPYIEQRKVDYRNDKIWNEFEKIAVEQC